MTPPSKPCERCDGCGCALHFEGREIATHHAVTHSGKCSVCHGSGQQPATPSEKACCEAAEFDGAYSARCPKHSGATPSTEHSEEGR